MAKLADDPRQSNQLLAVNSTLQAIESPQGHDESFEVSYGLA